MNRRDLLEGISSTTGFLFLQNAGLAAPRVGANDKLTIGCIGVGSQGLRVLLDLLRLSEMQIVAVCDVNRGSSDYLDWGPNELRDKVRTVLQDPSWGAHLPGPSAGRQVAQDIVNTFYASRAAPRMKISASFSRRRETLML